MSSSLPSVILSIDMITGINIEKSDDNVNYLYNNRSIDKIRILGTVLYRRESITKSGTQMLSFTVDDSTGIIRMNVWKRQHLVHDVFLDAKNIKLGSIIDIFGWIKIFNNEFYISPIIIKHDLSIADEISRRIKLLICNKEDQNILTVDVEINEKFLEFLQYFEEDFTLNNVENLIFKSGLKEKEVIIILKELSIHSLIITPQAGCYKKVS